MTFKRPKERIVFRKYYTYSAAADKSKRTVMICDDEKDILFAFAIELQTKYNVLTAESGEQCIKKYLDTKRSGRKIDLILLDYRLGDTAVIEAQSTIAGATRILRLVRLFRFVHLFFRGLKIFEYSKVLYLLVFSVIYLTIWVIIQELFYTMTKL